jgi:NAD+ kinase
VKTVGVIANLGKTEARPALRRLAVTASQLGLKLVAAGPTASHLPSARRVAIDRIGSSCDVLITLGGDGTMLLAARLLHGSDTPLLGVNFGKLGFLTGVPADDLERAVANLAKGKFRISTRTAIDCTVWRKKKKIGQYRALNDIVAGWGQASRIVTFDVAVNDEPITSYLCDGIIVATPTGTTGHSLSAGGPILHPEAAAFLINVICPHALSARPIVVPDRSVIEVTVANAQKRLLLSIDGQEEQAVAQGDRLVIRRSAKGVRFIHLPGYSYFSVLRKKLHWRGSSVGDA